MKPFIGSHDTILKRTRCSLAGLNEGVLSMLAEKFFLMLESLIRAQAHPDGCPRVVSTSPHVPVKLNDSRSKQ
ncbi:MAG TPA: hypothetical protein VFR21_20540 [Bradyrhizobium sp.]|jgi:hypothetical protein|nr:hypothetical protein [Bradyrhizobium sp.]